MSQVGTMDVNGVSPESDLADDYDLRSAEYAFAEYLVEELEKTWDVMSKGAQKAPYGLRVARLLSTVRGRRDRLRGDLMRLRTPDA